MHQIWLRVTLKSNSRAILSVARVLSSASENGVLHIGQVFAPALCDGPPVVQRQDHSNFRNPNLIAKHFSNQDLNLVWFWLQISGTKETLLGVLEGKMLQSPERSFIGPTKQKNRYPGTVSYNVVSSKLTAKGAIAELYSKNPHIRTTSFKNLSPTKRHFSLFK